jgi:tRNA threonylcarbamoyladenosine biosynthesis protein TsaE
MNKKYRVFSSEETEKAGASLAQELEKKGIKRAFIALRGEMGVGKTAFSRGFAGYFGVRSVKSPTYTVLNEYRGRVPIHHFDFYRITDGDDLYSIGYDDIIEEDGYCLGEWSENISDFLPENTVTVTISRASESVLGEDTSNIRDIEINYSEGCFI